MGCGFIKTSNVKDPKRIAPEQNNSFGKSDVNSEKIENTSAIPGIEKIHLKDGSTFIGKIYPNKTPLSGRLSFMNGDIYEGKFKNNHFGGFGIYKDSTGVTYEGEWLNNQKHGKGVEIWPDGTRYEGSFIEDKKQGIGKLKFKDGSEYYGQFANNDMEGDGIYDSMEFKYQGKWVANKMSGKGKTLWKTRNINYIGYYLEGKKHGLGKMAFPDGKIFVGFWSFGKRNGNGIEIDEKGGKSKGCWNNDEKTMEIKLSEQKNFEQIFAFLETLQYQTFS